jgi:hypothetical protein
VHGQATSARTPLNSTVEQLQTSNPSVLRHLVTLGTIKVLSLVVFFPLIVHKFKLRGLFSFDTRDNNPIYNSLQNKG